MMTGSHSTHIRPKLGRKQLFSAMALLLAAPFSATPALSQALSFKDFPFVIYCNAQGIDHAFYFSKLGEDGVAVYLTPDRQAGTITIDGVGHRVGGEQSGSCSGKTLDELRAAGLAFDLPK